MIILERYAYAALYLGVNPAVELDWSDTPSIAKAVNDQLEKWHGETSEKCQARDIESVLPFLEEKFHEYGFNDLADKVYETRCLLVDIGGDL